MLDFLRTAPWPPQIEPGETVLAEGHGKKAIIIRTVVVSVLLGLLGLVMLEIFFRALTGSAIFPSLLFHSVSPIVTGLSFLVLFYYLEFRESRWMLTTKRLIQQGKGAIPRSEIGAIRLDGSRRLARIFPRSVVIDRSGPDMLLRGPKFRLANLEDPEGVRDTLERLA